jgi:hypothetical protein
VQVVFFDKENDSMMCARFRPPGGRLLAFACLSAAVLLGSVMPADAGTLLPGTLIANDGSVVTAGGGALLADTGKLAFTMKDKDGVTTGTGFARSIVVSGDTSNIWSAAGGLTFVYQVVITSGDLGSVSLSSFNTNTVWKTDASAVSTAAVGLALPVGTPAFDATSATGTLNPGNPLPIERSLSGGVISFDFATSATSAPIATVLMIVRTDGTTFIPGNIAVQDGGNANVFGYAPNPEPATMTMAAFGIVGLVGYGWRKRRQTVAKQETPSVA